MLLLLAILVVLLIVLPIVGIAVWMLISVAVVGGIIGALARLVIPGRQDIGILATILIGWIGSLIGNLIGYHALHAGRIVTVLIEIGVAAVLVALASSSAGSSVARRNRSLRW